MLFYFGGFWKVKVVKIYCKMQMIPPLGSTKLMSGVIALTEEHM